MSKPQKKAVGVLDTKKVKIFEKHNDNTIKQLTDTKDTDWATVRKLMGYALNTVREHGVSLHEWSHLEFDAYNIFKNENGTDVNYECVDIHFMDNDRVNISVYGILLDDRGSSTKIVGFDCIGIQPKPKV